MAGNIVITQYISLDGVIEDPVGMEGTGLGDWTGPYNRGPLGDAFKERELRDAVAMIYGRRTYDGFAAVWPQVSGDFADRMNALPKYLASTTIKTPEWNNASLLGANLEGAVRDLKSRINGDILIYGSGSICHTLLSHGLVDEISLMTYPVVLGRGIRLFPLGVATNFRLIGHEAFDDGIMLTRYRLAD
ncbi:hypothetical protein TH9_15375 [Thalassospira xiamenensis]|uniref:dihydrofolate reductase family protein n=1 Tax=Thalassospira xiamenensis TaxID=220697 RepID=UPI000DED4E8A|nr:dihydrofolate reductase family protein [Thalassospira xiamenensis]RCK32064.1 hypothetical protein TH9_15375 [Thalassospira xiamenensis]